LTLSHGKVKPDELIENILQLYRPATRMKNIDLENYSEDFEDPIWIDGDKYEQVIGNLLSIAIKYTRSGGWVKQSLIRKSDILELKIIDSGIGMNDDDIKKLLINRQEVRSSRGISGEKSTGIGFTIIKHTIGLFEGEIQIESTRGEGTTFTVEVRVKLNSVLLTFNFL
jgi:signal transduction histidine kinase